MNNILVLLFLNCVLIVNLHIINHKRNFDIIGILVFLFIAIKIFKIVKKRKGFKRKKLRIFTQFLIDGFFLLLLINTTVNMSHLFSNGVDAKIFRISEYIQVLFFSFIITIAKFKSYKKFFPEFILIYLLIPPGSVTSVQGYLLYPNTLIIIFITLLWIIYSKIINKISITIPLLTVCILPLIYIFLPFLGFLNNSWTLNLLEFISSNLISIGSAFIISFTVKKEKDWHKIFILILLGFIIKLFIIGFIPSPNPTRGAVNNNLYAISFEFFFFIVLILFLRVKEKILKIILFLLLLLVLLNIYNLQSTTALFAISFTIIYMIGLYLFIKSFPKSKNYIFQMSFISLIILIGSSLFYILSKYTTASMNVRIKIWELAFRGWTSSIKSFLIGVGDYGKINFLQYVKLIDAEEIKNFQEFGSGFFQLHIHNEYLAFAYGSGLLYILVFFLLALYPIFRLSKNIQNFSIYHAFGLVIFSYLIHGLTEPIVSAGLTGFIFWLCYFSVMINVKEDNQLFYKINNKFFKPVFSILMILIVYFSIGNIFYRDLIQLFFHSPQIQTEVRDLEKDHKKIVLNKNELKSVIEKTEIKVKYFPTSIYEFVNLADIYLYQAKMNKEKNSPNRSRNLYCKSFDLLPIPSFYNNLRNISNMEKKELGDICTKEKNISEKLYRFDLYNLVPSNFY